MGVARVGRGKGSAWVRWQKKIGEARGLAWPCKRFGVGEVRCGRGFGVAKVWCGKGSEWEGFGVATVCKGFGVARFIYDNASKHNGSDNQMEFHFRPAANVPAFLSCSQLSKDIM